MKGFIKWMDSAPLLIKILFALPVLNVVYAIYRIAKGLDKGNLLLVIVGIIWIFLGTTILWIVDLICIILFGKPTVLV